MRYWNSLSLALALLVLVSFPAIAAEEQTDTFGSVQELACAEDQLISLMTPVKDGPQIGPVRENTLSCNVAQCSDYPSSPWSTCSCSSEAQRKRCIRECDKQKGRVIKRTCVVNPGCAPGNQSCDIQQNQTYESFYCARF